MKHLIANASDRLRDWRAKAPGYIKEWSENTWEQTKDIAIALRRDAVDIMKDLSSLLACQLVNSGRSLYSLLSTIFRGG